MYATLAEETNLNAQLDRLEKLFQTYLLIPSQEIRERILIKIY